MLFTNHHPMLNMICIQIQTLSKYSQTKKKKSQEFHLQVNQHQIDEFSSCFIEF